MCLGERGVARSEGCLGERGVSRREGMCLGEGVSKRKEVSGYFNPCLYVHHYFNTTGLIL